MTEWKGRPSHAAVEGDDAADEPCLVHLADIDAVAGKHKNPARRR